MIDDESRDFPKWMHNDFLSGMVYMIKSMGILNKFPSNKSLFNALNGLDALLQSKGLNAISKPSSGLVGFKLKSESDDLVIELTVKQSEFIRVKQMFDSLTEEEIKNWSNSKVEIISD
jgi:chemotaxis methyl-accepting protein methylase